MSFYNHHSPLKAIKNYQLYEYNRAAGFYIKIFCSTVDKGEKLIYIITIVKHA